MKEETLRFYRERILQVLLHIQRHLDEELPLLELADVACLSPYHFHRVFRGMVGESVAEHVRRLRLERAALQLKHTRYSVARVAFDAGYESHEAFTRAFKGAFGESPPSTGATEALLLS
jgi:AraC family transcriptional regulator